MSTRRWMAQHYRDSLLTRIVARQVPRTVAWLRAARRTFPAFVVIVVASVLTGIDVSRVVLAVTWPTLTVVLLAVTDETSVSGTRTNTGPPAE